MVQSNASATSWARSMGMCCLTTPCSCWGSMSVSTMPGLMVCRGRGRGRGREHEKRKKRRGCPHSPTLAPLSCGAETPGDRSPAWRATQTCWPDRCSAMAAVAPNWAPAARPHCSQWPHAPRCPAAASAEMLRVCHTQFPWCSSRWCVAWLRYCRHRLAPPRQWCPHCWPAHAGRPAGAVSRRWPAAPATPAACRSAAHAGAAVARAATCRAAARCAPGVAPAQQQRGRPEAALGCRQLRCQRWRRSRRQLCCANVPCWRKTERVTRGDGKGWSPPPSQSLSLLHKFLPTPTHTHFEEAVAIESAA